ncbi:MAG TPA: hypothetical protein DDZ96_05795 [Porphyromonadaceae bacterium]|nr:hypothetical protein [Porphyromonadaceae bacterium]HBL33319.1 hypothetical protein [Porphyromonadaceae bacterium]HBX21182.1 hypothetical protein [Porphyromonadaceae bacterium]HCM20849.1 hypothetical protein [Porphyromonadaceae bacterium]
MLHYLSIFYFECKWFLNVEIIKKTEGWQLTPGSTPESHNCLNVQHGGNFTSAKTRSSIQ